MALPFLYPIVDVVERAAGIEFLKTLLALPIEIVQIRAKQMQLEESLSLAIEARALRDELNPRCLLIVNDFPELALQADVDGVHLGQEDASPDEARRMLGPNALIGLSTHNIDQVRQVPFDLLDYIGFGPVFASPTKSGHAPETGLDRLREASEISTLPVVAIGGVHSGNAESVYGTGAASIAVISDLQRTKNLADTFAQYQRAFESAGGG